jgi:hypothetical protein
MHAPDQRPALSIVLDQVKLPEGPGKVELRTHQLTDQVPERSIIAW